MYIRYDTAFDSMLIYIFPTKKSQVCSNLGIFYFFYYCFPYDKVWNQILNSDGQQLHQNQQKL